MKSVGKTVTSPVDALVKGIGKGLSGNGVLLPLMIGGGVVLVVVLSRK